MENVETFIDVCNRHYNSKLKTEQTKKDRFPSKVKEWIEKVVESKFKVEVRQSQYDKRGVDVIIDNSSILTVLDNGFVDEDFESLDIGYLAKCSKCNMEISKYIGTYHPSFEKNDGHLLSDIGKLTTNMIVCTKCRDEVFEF